MPGSISNISLSFLSFEGYFQTYIGEDTHVCCNSHVNLVYISQQCYSVCIISTETLWYRTRVLGVSPDIVHKSNSPAMMSQWVVVVCAMR